MVTAVRRPASPRMRAPIYHIRRGRPSDIAALSAIERAASSLFAGFSFAHILSGSVTPVEILTEAEAMGRLFVAVTAADAPVGFALVATVDGQAHLDELDVDPRHGRRGLGAALVGAACAWGERMRADAITLSTFRDVPWNAPFYARLGFRILDAHELTPGLRRLLEADATRGLPVESRVIMRRELGVTVRAAAEPRREAPTAKS
jgi:GNAT superfamily N-acetyltransferase